MSESLYYGQLFDNFDDFEQLFHAFTNKSYTLWTTVSSALIKGTSNYKYMHYKCIHYINLYHLSEIETLDNRIFKLSQNYLEKSIINLNPLIVDLLDEIIYTTNGISPIEMINNFR